MINDRIKELRKSLGMTQAEFAERLGLDNSSISKIEKGIASVTEGNIKFICSAYNVSEKWLRDGAGDMFIKPTSLYQALGYQAETLDPDVERIMLNFITLKKEDKIKLIELVKKIFDID